MIRPPFLVLAGPTAVGKSEIALLLAEELNGEIVSVDSMQVYRGMDIGTAKPSGKERRRIPHHLIDILDVAESFDAARFVQLASGAIADIQTRGRLPILCGGTGLYFKALFEGLGETPPSDTGLRAELGTIPLPDLLRELQVKDPETYERIDRQNARRVVRALEVIRLTGKPFSQQRAKWSEFSSVRSDLFGLTRGAGDLCRRIDSRVEEIFRQGLLDETAALLSRGLSENPTASQAIGYKQAIEHLRGLRPLSETIDLVKIRTRQYAKRQLTWFRRQHRLVWIVIPPEASANSISERISVSFKKAPLASLA